MRGVPVGALLGDEDFFYSRGVERVGSQAVDGFGGEGYGAALAQETGGTGDVGRIGGFEALGGHSSYLTCGLWWFLPGLRRETWGTQVPIGRVLHGVADV